MKIYKLSVDFKYKLLSLIDNNESKTKVYSIFEDKSNENLLDDFDAQCYGDEFIIKKDLGNLLKIELKDKVRLLSVDIEGITSGCFCLVDIVDDIKSISFEGLDYKESMKMIKSNNIDFIYENVKDEIIFRDEKLNKFYYCTDILINFVEKNNIKGLRFDKVGIASPC